MEKDDEQIESDDLEARLFGRMVMKMKELIDADVVMRRFEKL